MPPYMALKLHLTPYQVWTVFGTARDRQVSEATENGWGPGQDMPSTSARRAHRAAAAVRQLSREEEDVEVSACLPWMIRAWSRIIPLWRHPSSEVRVSYFNYLLLMVNYLCTREYGALLTAFCSVAQHPLQQVTVTVPALMRRA